MQKWFSKIDTRDDALTVIRNSSSAFFALAGLQIVVVGLLFAIGADTDVLIDMFATALIFALFAFLLRDSSSLLFVVKRGWAKNLVFFFYFHKPKRPHLLS